MVFLFLPFSIFLFIGGFRIYKLTELFDDGRTLKEILSEEGG